MPWVNGEFISDQRDIERVWRRAKRRGDRSIQVNGKEESLREYESRRV